MKKLTLKFIKNLGFKLHDTITEDEFYYEEYTMPSLDDTLVIFFNYYNDPKITIDVVFNAVELENVGEAELETLLKIIPKTGS